MTNPLRKCTLTLRIVICLTALAVAKCQERPALVDRLGTLVDEIPSGPCGYRGGILFAPIVVVGVVEENRVVAEHIEAAQYPGLFLDLHAVRVKRENSLRGGLRDPALTFYYFAQGIYPDSRANPRHKQLFEAVPGSRYLFFLIRDRGVLRSIGDVGNYSIRVATGTHPAIQGRDPSEEGPDIENIRLGRQMTEVLLTPGPGTDFEAMAGRLSTQACFAQGWISRLLVARILRKLTSQPEPVGSAACAALTHDYYGQEDCLKALAEDVTRPAEIRETASKLLKKQLADRPRLLESLDDPAESFYLAAAGAALVQYREELQTMLLGTDAALHARICEILKRSYPNHAEPKCSEPRKRPARQ